MSARGGQRRSRVAGFEACEERLLTTMVFVLSGNALGAAPPGTLTADAAHVLDDAGFQAVQLGYPDVSNPAVFYGIARQMLRISHGAPIGIVGFSAGGTLAVRLAGVKALHVTGVLDEYGPPDAHAYFQYHGDDNFAQGVRSISHVDNAMIDLLSGPVRTSAYVDAAFGLYDPNAVATMCTASLEQDVPDAHVFTYQGGHGVSIHACPAALDDFLAHLSAGAVSAAEPAANSAGR